MCINVRARRARSAGGGDRPKSLSVHAGRIRRSWILQLQALRARRLIRATPPGSLISRHVGAHPTPRWSPDVMIAEWTRLRRREGPALPTRPAASRMRRRSPIRRTPAQRRAAKGATRPPGTTAAAMPPSGRPAPSRTRPPTSTGGQPRPVQLRDAKRDDRRVDIHADQCEHRRGGAQVMERQPASQSRRRVIEYFGSFLSLAQRFPSAFRVVLPTTDLSCENDCTSIRSTAFQSSSVIDCPRLSR
jgi:hypothetical protein